MADIDVETQQDNAFDQEDPLSRLPGETARAFEAFQDFIALGTMRSMRLLAVSYRERIETGGEKPPTKSEKVIEDWSAKYHWRARLGRLLEIRAAEREARMAERQAQLEEADWRDGQELRQRVVELLAEFPKFRQRTVEEKTDDNGNKTVVITLALNASVAQLSQALKAASDLQRHGAAEPDTTQAVKVSEGFIDVVVHK